MKYGTWAIAQPYQQSAADRLSNAGFSPITSAVLASRGYDTPEKARNFLRCDPELSDPFELLDMDKACARVKRALDSHEHVCVFGDYDVDGITATCLLTEFLRSVGGRVTSYIPARLEEGYGLNPMAIDTLKAQGVQLIITVDCGITANDEAELCRSLGIELVITDHHKCKSELPAAVAVVDPHRPDQAFAHCDLAGVGVAFKLAAAIYGDQYALMERFSDLLCLGTVADVMPLIGENRTMVAHGLEALCAPKRVGVAALMAECVTPGTKTTAGTIGYTLAPRINAAGRMGEVYIATELFLTKDPERAAELAQQLCRLNRKRQDIEGGIYQDAVSMLPKNQMPSAIVLADETWHQGVVGIVASRLSEEYACPAFLICLDGEKGKASSRSYGGFNLFRSLQELSPLLESYGGHELAAGFTIRRDRIDSFRESICRRVDEYCASGASSSALQIDCMIPPALLTIANVQALDELEPCGAGCPRPVLCMSGLTVTELSEVGGGKHLRLRLTRGRHSFQAIFFSATALQAGVSQGDLVEIAFTPQVNEFRTSRTVQLNLIDIRPDEQSRREREASEEIYRRFSAGKWLLSSEAAQILPQRSDFVALWRYITAEAVDQLLQEEPGCLSRRLKRQTGQDFSCGKLFACLDIFCEQGLLSVQRVQKTVKITILDITHKVDLEQSPMLLRLRHQRNGE